jgi:hypothetical protein
VTNVNYVSATREIMGRRTVGLVCFSDRPWDLSVLHQPASVAWFQNLSAAEQEGIRLAPESDQNAQNNVWKLVQQVHAEWNGKFLAGQVLIESANRRAVASATSGSPAHANPFAV